MADFALSNESFERYGAIEKAYCEERWMEVIHDGQTLLGDLDRAADPPQEGLKERLHLLVAHAFLYGLGDRDSAEDLYQAVLRSGAEASLRQIAEQGLQQCALPVSPVDLKDEQPPSPAAELTAAAAGTWTGPTETLDPTAAGGGAAGFPEPAAAQPDPQDSWGSEASLSSAGPDASLAWLPTEAPAELLNSAPPPVMPWLEEGAAAAPVPVITPRSQPADASASTGAGWGSGEAFAASIEAAAEPSAAANAVASETGLNPETAASPQASEAAVANQFQPQPAASEREAGSEASVEAASPYPGESQAAEAAGLLGTETRPPTLQQDQGVEPLMADVVEEPDLIELHQASGRADEVLLLPSEPEAPTSESAPAGWRSGVDRRSSDLEILAPPAQSPVAVSSGPVQQEGDQEQAPGDLSVTVSPPAPVVVTAGGAFITPPEPVAEEDPELLLGLLKVEMG